MGYKGRDIEVYITDDGFCLVASCDSCGAIGSKTLDLLKVPAGVVGQLTARVALMEVLCTGAQPRIMTVAVSAEPDPTGKEIIKGVRQELERAGFKDLPLAISTEKNFTPRQTGLGIGVTGTCRISDLRVARSRPGDRVYCLGIPRVGKEVTQTPADEIIGTAWIQTLLNRSGVHDLVPVGSRGILAETRGLARQISTEFIPVPDPGLDLHKPAGPSTCAIFTVDPAWKPAGTGPLPLTRIGRLTDTQIKP